MRKQPRKRIPLRKAATYSQPQALELVSEDKLQVSYTFKPPFDNGKLYFIPITSVPVVNQRYYLNDYPEVDNGKVIGIEFYDSENLPNVVINGTLYNVLGTLEAAQVNFSIYDASNEPILYRSPLNSFKNIYTIASQRKVLELRDYSQLKISTGKSYFEFTQSVWISVFPLVIPIRFIY